jgi:hypothetical protein
MAVSAFSLARGTSSLPTPDALLGVYRLILMTNGGLLAAGHLVLRHFGRYSRWAYSLMGGVAAALAHVMALRCQALLVEPMPGTVFTAAVMPVLAGVLSGFLYGQFAGIEHAPMPASGDVGPSATAADSFRGRFEGPIRVRTSLGQSPWRQLCLRC